MQPGKLRHRVTIEQAIETQDADGKILPDTWETVLAREPAEVLPDRASEYFAAQQVQSSANAMIRIRHRAQVTTAGRKIRAVHHVEPGVDEFWSIEGVVPFQYRFREMRLMCLRRDAEGYRRGTDVANG